MWNEWSSMITSTIHKKPDITTTERMSYLQSFVIGPAKESISGFLCNPNFYNYALKKFNRRFGNPQNVISALSQELEAFQRPQVNDHRSLISYAALLRKIVQKLLAHGFNADLSATYLLKFSRDKIPNSLKMKRKFGVLGMDGPKSAPVDNCRKPVHKTTTIVFKQTFEETILRFLTTHKEITLQQMLTATPTINIDTVIKERTKVNSDKQKFQQKTKQ